MSQTTAANPVHTHSLDQDHKEQNTRKQSKDQSRRPPALPFVMRRLMTESPTFHRDPARSSSSDNGSLASPFSFPPRAYEKYGGPRDSVTTHNSSIYPPSTSSYSNNSPPSPSSPSTASFAASILTGGDDGMDTHEHILDTDDVSYRLRLLMRNNYFLPPAHSKPSQSELSLLAVESAAANIQPAKSPTFRDFFRVGKTKTPNRSPTHPQKTLAPAPPPLRQTKSHNALRPPAHETSLLGSSTSSSLAFSQGGPSEKKGRVVVIREKVEDIAAAAQEAEVQMRAQQQAQAVPRMSGERGRPRSSSSRSRRRELIDDFVDPTEAVDLPSYSFQPQASAFHGLGLGIDSAGLSAAVLAEQLPPPGSPEPGLSKEDMLWRKALLHQAVGLSMLSIPNSPSSTPNKSNIRSKSPSYPRSPNTTHAPLSKSAAILTVGNQPILEDITRVIHSSTPDPPKRKDSLPVTKPPPRDRLPPLPNIHHRGTPSPAPRSETPAAPSQPLQPPPRRNLARPAEPTASPSPNMDLKGAIHSDRFPLDNNEDTIRKTLTRPLLSEGYETDKTKTSSMEIPLQFIQPMSPTLLLQTPDGRQSVPPGARQTTVRDGAIYSIISESIHSEDGTTHQGDESFNPLGQDSIDDSQLFTKPRPSFAMSHPSGHTRPSDESARDSQESAPHSNSYTRPSISDSHQSHFSHAFGPRAGTHQGRQESFSPELRLRNPSPSPSMMVPAPVTGPRLSAVGGPVPSVQVDHPSSDSSKNSSNLALRRSQNPAALDLAPPASPNELNLQSGPPVDDAPLDFFDRLQIESPGLKSGWLDDPMESDGEDDPAPSTVVYMSPSQPRSRVSSNAPTVVPSPGRKMFALRTVQPTQDTQPVMQFPNSSNPYLQPGTFNALDPSKPLTNTPPTSYGGIFSSLASGFNLGSRGKESFLNLNPGTHSIGKTLSPTSSPQLSKAGLPLLSSRKGKIPDSTYDLMRYAHDAKARSTPSLSPSKKIFTEPPGRHSNVDSGPSLRPKSPYSFGRKSTDFVAAWTVDQAVNQSPEVRKLDGLLTQHMQQEKDMIRRMARGNANT